jgi:hypothetical protein
MKNDGDSGAPLGSKEGTPDVEAIFRIETVVTETFYVYCDYHAGNPAVVPGSN